jgi:hypothetical protein
MGVAADTAARVLFCHLKADISTSTKPPAIIAYGATIQLHGNRFAEVPVLVVRRKAQQTPTAVTRDDVRYFDAIRIDHKHTCHI